MMWWTGKARCERLDAAIETFSKEMFVQSSPTDAQRDAVEQAVECARQSFKHNKLQAGWGFLGAARRLELLTLTPEALRARAAALAQEASEKLGSWRQPTAAELLPNERQGLDDASLCARVWLVQSLLDGHSDNQYFKQEIVWEAVRVLLWELVALVIVALIALTVPELRPPSEWPLLHVALFGAIGACFSGIRSLSARNKSKIPDAVLSTGLTLTRPVIGAAAGIIVFLALKSGIVSVANDSVAAILTLAFAAGFSESLVVRVVELVEKSTAKS